MYQIVFSNDFLKNFDATRARQNAPQLAGPSLKIMNLSNRGISVFDGSGNQMDYIAAYDYLIVPNTRDFSLLLDSATTMDWLHPSAVVAVRDIPDYIQYESGHLVQLTAQAPLSEYTVNGTMQVAANQEINIGTMPAVQIANNQNINVASMPALTIANNQSVNATIENAQINSEVVNQLLPTNASVFSPPQSVQLTNLAAGATTYAFLSVPIARYDEVSLIAHSPGGYMNSLQFSLYGLKVDNPTNIYQKLYGNNFVTSNSTANDLVSVPFLLGSIVYGDTVVIAIKNTGNTAIMDTLSISTMMHYASQSVSYSLASFIPPSFAIASETVPSGGKGAITYTGSVATSNLKRAQLYVQSGGSGYVSGKAGLAIAFQGSFDNNTWFDIQGTSTIANIYTYTLSGVNNSVADSNILPQMAAGYPYLRFKVYQFNNDSVSYTMSNSGVWIYFYYNL